MSDDTADFAPPGGPPATGDSASAEEGVAEIRRRREAGTANLAPEPDPTEPPPVKLTNAEKSELDPRQGAKLVRQLRADEAARAQAYASAAEGATREINQRFASLTPEQQQAGEPARAAAAELMATFSDIHSAEDLKRLQAEDPGRAARFDYLNGLVQRGVPDRPSGEQSDPDLSVQAEYAKLEHQKQEFEIEKRIATLDPALQHQAQLVKQLGNEVAAAFPEIRSQEDVQRLAATDPQRFALYAQCHQLLANGTQQVYGALQQQYLEGKAKYARESAAKDQEWFSKHPEFANDTAALQRDQGAAIAAMARAGVPGEDLDDLWSGAKSIDLRHPAAQELLWMAGKYIQGQQALAEAQTNSRAGKLSPVLRPGMRGSPRSEDAHAQLENARRALERNPDGQAGIRAGMAAMRAQRALKDRS